MIFLIYITLFAPLAQSADQYRHPIDLFETMAADTVTRVLFNVYEGGPELRLEAVDPVPGRPIRMDALGVVAADLDEDGWTDVILPIDDKTQRAPSRVLWGGPDGSFETGGSGLPDQLTRVRPADLDGDGLTDLVALVNETPRFRSPRHSVSVPGTEGHRELYVLKNLGQRRFRARALGLAASELALIDHDGDGWLDILAITSTAELAGLTGFRLLSGGPDGFGAPTRFPSPPAPLPNPKLLSADVDRDGARELLVQSSVVFNPDAPVLQLDLAADPRRWTAGQSLLPAISLSVAAADADGNGTVDYFHGVSDFEGGRQQLLLRDTAGQLVDHGRRAGLWSGYTYVFASAWGDVDNDGRPDLFQCRFRSEGRHTTSQLYWNRGDTTFVNVTDRLSEPAEPGSRGAIWLDGDQDGRLDLLTSASTDYFEVMPFDSCRVRLYRNRSEVGQWLAIKLVGPPPNTDAIGAELVLWAEGRPQWREVGAVDSYSGTHPPLVQHFGLGDATRCDSVVVRWPLGATQVFGPLSAGQRHRLVAE